MDAELERKMQALVDRQEIEDVLMTYCRAIDRIDKDLLKSVYHPDGIDEHGSFTGNAHEFADYIMEALKAQILGGIHTVTHCLIKVDGHFATSEAYYWAWQACHGGEEAVTAFFGADYAAQQKAAGTLDCVHDYYCGGRYIDIFEKRNGVWKVLHRRITQEWSDIHPTTRITHEGYVANYDLPGTRDRNDPAYTHLPPGWAKPR